MFMSEQLTSTSSPAINAFSFSSNINLLGQVFILDEVIWVALTAIKNYKHGGLVHVVHTGVIQTVLLPLRDKWRRPAVVALPNTHLPYQDFGQERVADQIWPRLS